METETGSAADNKKFKDPPRWCGVYGPHEAHDWGTLGDEAFRCDPPRAALERAIWRVFPFPPGDAGPKHREAIGNAISTVDDYVTTAIAAAAPQPPPGESSPTGLKHAVTSNRLGHALAALRELREATFEGTPAGDIVRSALAGDTAIRDNVTLTSGTRWAVRSDLS
jgi:hypothetical protein